jgi:transcriptional regulator with XRE-family HTH domain
LARNDPERVLRDIGRRLSELRTARGFTQEELAEVLEISARYVQRLEAGQNVTVRTLCAVADALGVRLTELLEPPQSRGRRLPGRPRRS